MEITPTNYPGGQWVEADKVDAMTNLGGRCARFESGLETAVWEYVRARHGRVTHWYFADQQMK